jgi:hypothetical protein
MSRHSNTFSALRPPIRIPPREHLFFSWQYKTHTHTHKNEKTVGMKGVFCIYGPPALSAETNLASVFSSSQ